MKYVKRNAIAGRAFGSFAELEGHLDGWMREADQRVHGTTHERPIDRFLRAEAAALRPLPANPLPLRERRLRRRVANDALVDVDTVRTRVLENLARLRLGHLADRLDALLAEAARGEPTYLAMGMTIAHFPSVKTHSSGSGARSSATTCSPPPSSSGSRPTHPGGQKFCRLGVRKQCRWTSVPMRRPQFVNEVWPVCPSALLPSALFVELKRSGACWGPPVRRWHLLGGVVSS